MKKLSLRSLIPNLFTFISLTLGLTALKFAIENKWEISVSPDPKKRGEPLTPDWLGYMRIDKF